MRTPAFLATCALVCCTSAGIGDDSGEPPQQDTEIFLSSCAGTGSTTTPFEAECVEEDCPTDCSSNTKPTLDSPQYLVNGTLAAVPPAAVGDRTAIVIGFTDAECNLACGSRSYSFFGPEDGEADLMSLASNLPCASASSSVYLGFDVGEVESGEYTYVLGVEDICGADSNRVEGSFAVP